MTRFVALLRAVNLGPVNRVSNAALREWVADLGYSAVKTHLASGNVVFTADETDRDVGAAKIAARIKDETGFDIAVLGRTHGDLVAALEGNPSPNAEEKQLVVTFLGGEPSTSSVDKLNALKTESEELVFAGEVAYLHCPDGLGRSKLAARFNKTIDVVATGRNLRTVRTLADLTAD